MFGFNFFTEPRPFESRYKCYSVSLMPGSERKHLENGGKIILPPSALDHLTRLNIVYPMLFKLTNEARSRSTHCGVLEFVADEGMMYIPYWMLQNLQLEEGELCKIESATLPVATFAKFQPQSVDFLDLTNPKAVLESILRNYACLSTGDVIAIFYNNKMYELSVLETKPAAAVSVIECDLNVDFAPPIGYEEPKHTRKTDSHAEEEQMDVTDMLPDSTAFVPFSGSGTRLDGKKRRTISENESVRPKCEYVRGIPDYDFEVGTIRFIRNSAAQKTTNGKADSGDDDSADFKPFVGQGNTLRTLK